MEERKLNEKESLELISQMIRNTKQRLEDGSGKPFLIWGYTTFIVSLVVFYFINMTGNYFYHWIWFAIPIIGSILMLLFSRNDKKHGFTFIDRIIGNIWTVLGIAAVMISLSAFFVRIPILPLMLLLMGIGTTLTGLVIQFKPVILSGILGMVSCVLPFLMPGSEQILVFGFMFLIMMVIPGHILNYNGRKMHV